MSLQRAQLTARCAALVVLFLLAGHAFAHKPSDSYLSLTATGSEIRGQWDIALRDLDFAIGLDRDDDGAITWRELRTLQAEVSAYALARLKLFAQGKPCPPRATELLVDRHTDGAYAVIRFEAACPSQVLALTAEYRLFFDLDPLHRGLTSVGARGATITAIFSPEQPRQQFELGKVTAARQLAAFVGEGMSHIWIGIDHILFLLALLLPSMFVRSKNAWIPVASLRDAFWSVFRIVTAFTVAHSITLSLAALEVVSLPSRWVETVIAASVLLAALNNLWPVVVSRLWLVALGFGLVHGFGFAAVLTDLGLPRDALLLSLFGFNLGVEFGQLVIVAVYFAVAYGMRATRLYGRVVLSGGSALIAIVATLWMIERAFNIALLPF